MDSLENIGFSKDESHKGVSVVYRKHNRPIEDDDFFSYEEIIKFIPDEETIYIGNDEFNKIRGMWISYNRLKAIVNAAEEIFHKNAA